ncbi:unnamed protein product [Polarella glacialis]|uniref:non-specific serine/threonine protein kinase n=1 Tax=Polarella glacialis TaxID=89957 RepID=A0A813LHH7_POLGL|nr:unnamed protein product [Polarella glacialis]CAE8732395.1 unnamed protein product [Polarella glacialis]
MPYCIGDLAGDYEVLRLLGRGACGEVFMVQGSSRTVFAMKVVPCDVGGGGDEDDPNSKRVAAANAAREAALAEARLLQNLRHPHIVSCMEVSFDAERGAVRLVLEYMDGGDLHGFIEQQREVGHCFEAHFPRSVLAAVGGALAYVHSAGVLHRDVKPANVLISRRSRRIKLADFGIAKLVEANTLKAQTLVGTPHYFSPELVSGEEYGPASDCWALGACLYEVVALRRPFDASNQLALVRKICDESPAALPAGTAEDVAAAVDGLLLKDPLRRITLVKALAVSSAVAALVVAPSGDLPAPPKASSEAQGAPATQRPAAEATEKAPRQPPKSSLDDDSWHQAERVCTWRASCAAGLARAALASDEDDPDELTRALLALELERQELEEQNRVSELDLLQVGGEPANNLEITCDPAVLAAAAEGQQKQQQVTRRVSAAALASLGEELKSRLGAMRHDAVELLDDLLLDSSQENQDGAGTGAESSRSEGSRCSSVGSAEEALEVATTLGVDTGPAEERLACVRRMLSVRVVWGTNVCFFLLPLRVSFKALVQQVSSRYGLAAGMPPPQLCWREGGSESFALESQTAWEECLQRRGLAERPGRLELEVTDSSACPLPRRRTRRAPLPREGASARAAAAAAKNAAAAAPAPGTGDGFMIMGTQALRTTAATGSAIQTAYSGGLALGSPTVAAVGQGAQGPGGRGAGAGRRSPASGLVGGARRSVAAAPAAAQGRAWAMTTGREQPVRWKPQAGGGDPLLQPSPSGALGAPGELGLCLEGRPAVKPSGGAGSGAGSQQR